MDDASYDYVVCTFTLCSIPAVSHALLGINRVLKPRGNFVFLEHGLSDVTKVQAWQHRLNSLQKKIGDGCHLNRNIDDLVLGASFDITSLNRFHLPSVPKSHLCLNGLSGVSIFTNRRVGGINNINNAYKNSNFTHYIICRPKEES